MVRLKHHLPATLSQLHAFLHGTLKLALDQPLQRLGIVGLIRKRHHALRDVLLQLPHPTARQADPP